MSLQKEAVCKTVVERRLEVWRPVKNLTPQQKAEAKQIQLFPDRSFLGRLLRRKVAKALIDVDVKTFDLEDLVVDGGLNGLCGVAFDESGSRPAVFNYGAIGIGTTAPANGDTALENEVMRVKGTYTKDAGVGECSMDTTFNIDGTYAIAECGLLNAAAAGTLYCHDAISPVKNVISGDTINLYYTPKFQRPA